LQCVQSLIQQSSLLLFDTDLLHLHDSQFRVARSETEVGAGVGIGQAEDCPRHIADDAEDIACVVVKETNLVGSGSSRHNDVLFVVELSCVDEWCRRLSREGFCWLFFLSCSLCVLALSLTNLLVCEIDLLVLRWLPSVFLHSILQLLALLCVVLRYLRAIPVNISELRVLPLVP